MKDKWLLIPVYGFARALDEYLRVGDCHKRACQRHHRDPSPENYQATWDAMDATWPAMDKALAGLWITVGELAAIFIAGALIASLIR